MDLLICQIELDRAVTAPPVHINYPISLSVVDGVCYVSSPNGVVTALRVSDGSLLWRHVGGTTGEEAITTVDGVVYLAPVLPLESTATSVTVEALRASDGSLLWHYTSHASLVSLPSVAEGMVYAGTVDGHLYALRASDGSVLWTHTSLYLAEPLSPVVVDGIAYLNLQDGRMDVLRDDTGAVLWSYTPHTRALRLLPLPLITHGVV